MDKSDEEFEWECENEIVEYVQSYTDEDIIIPSVFLARYSLEVAVFLTVLLNVFYDLNDGKKWFRYSHKEMMKKTNLTKYTVIHCKKILKKRGIIYNKMAGIPAKEYYKVSFSNLKIDLDRGKRKDKIKKRNKESNRDKISLALRYKILHRDNFTCQYCGREAPEVKLHVDHIIPLDKKGLTIESNLITSCSDCNLGKSNINYFGEKSNTEEEEN
jgi:hypothetical protein